MKKTTKQSTYDDKMKAKGLVKTCIWISPDDFYKITNEGRLSRKRHDKRMNND